MRWIVALACTACVFGCYSPKFAVCTQACGPGGTCPAGLTCDNAVCRLPDQVGMPCVEPPVVDVNPNIDINPESCTFALVSTNFAPADVPDANPPPWDVTEDMTFETGGVDGHAVSQVDAEPLWIVHKSRFTVAPGVTLTLTGSHALVIAADEMDIKGTIRVENGTGHESCNAIPGTPSCDNGAGGGGGGYGGQGGDGGGPPAGDGGDPDGIVQTPLRGGCPGAKGGDGRTGAGDMMAQAGGDGGTGGGALQLSARKMIVIEGTIVANGTGGAGGRSDRIAGAACGASLTGRASGGGGGGGGGTIFIESCSVVITATAKLCANGGSGGGGSGGSSSGQDFGFPGANGTCDNQAIGGAGEIAGAQGGHGGFDGLPATTGQQASRGGGGGGGAVGRIHITQLAGTPTTAGATIRPPANRSQ